MGDPEDDRSDLGALISKSHFEKVNGYITLAKDEGLRVLCGGPVKGSDRCAQVSGIFN